MASPSKSSVPRCHPSGSGGSRPFQNYPLEPIGTRPSYVGEVISLVRDGTDEMKHLLENECDLRFNCKVCGSILPTARSFVVHKRQFCITKYLDYQRRNVAIMERASSLVSYETRGLQTDPLDSLDPLNPMNPGLFSVATNSMMVNGHSSPNGKRFEVPKTAKDPSSASSLEEDGQTEEDSGETPSGMEVIQPLRAPADGIYRFGMGGGNIMSSKKKKRTPNSMAPPKKKKKPVLFNYSGDDLATKNVVMHGFQRSQMASGSREVAMMDTSRSPGGSAMGGIQSTMGGLNQSPLQPFLHKVATASVQILPANHAPGMEPTKRSRRIAGVQPLPSEVVAQPPSGPAVVAPELFPADRTEIKMTPEQNERLNTIKNPEYIKKLLIQLSEVADYEKKICRECNRTVVSIYNLDRHVATQHLGLREAEYSLISKELRRLRTEIYGPVKADESGESGADTSRARSVTREPTEEPTSKAESARDTEEISVSQPVDTSIPADGDLSLVDHTYQQVLLEESPVKEEPVDPSHGAEEAFSSTPLEESAPVPVPALPTSSTFSFKDVSPRREREVSPHVDFSMEQLVEIQRQILDAADPFLQCCRICNKQYFDVYVLNRHVMTVHLRLPEKSVGTINKLIKEYMKRYPDAFLPDPREAMQQSSQAEEAAPVLVSAGDSGVQD